MSSTIGHINLWEKLTGKRNAENLHVAFDEAGTGNGLKARTAPVLDPTEKWGVKVTISFDEVVKDVDGLMLEINDPGLHLEYFEKAAELNKPIFLDKPLAGNINDGRAILEIAKKKGLKVWSSSSLRFTEAIVKATQEVSAPVFCNVFGPMGVSPRGSSLIWYGVHSYEMLMTIMGRGARSVLAKQDSKGIVSIVKYADDRRGIVECNEKAWFYGGRVQSKEKVKSFNVDTSNLYHNLIVKIMDFFVNDIIPVDLEDTLEIQAMMDAVERSLESNHEEGIRL